MSKPKLKWAFNRSNTSSGGNGPSQGGGPASPSSASASTGQFPYSPFGNSPNAPFPTSGGTAGFASGVERFNGESDFFGHAAGLAMSGGKSPVLPIYEGGGHNLAPGSPRIANGSGAPWRNGSIIVDGEGDGALVNGKRKRGDVFGPAEDHYFGLENFGNTCYCNSVLQALYYCPPFRALLSQLPNATPPVIPLGPSAEAISTWRAAHPEGVPGENGGGREGENGILGGHGKDGSGNGAGANGGDGASKAEGSLAVKRGLGFMGMGGRKGSSNLLGTIGSSVGGMPGTNGFTPPGGGIGAKGAPASPGQPALLSPSSPGLPSHASPAPVAVGPLPTMLSAVQSLFEYISSSPSHPPPPPKPVPVGSNTTAGPLLSSPNGPTTAAIRGGGPHGAGTLGKGVAKPDELVRTIRQENELFRSNMHQDAHEFLGWLLNKIAEDVEEMEKAAEEESQGQQASVKKKRKNHGKQGKTFIHSLFEGTLTNETRCLTCETTSSRDESFLDLSIDIEQNSSVTACLRQFSASEMLCQKNKFFCDTCSGLQEAEKRMKIKKLPNILALHLKRFKYMEEIGRYAKLSYRVTFPLQLRLFNTSDDVKNPDRLYELFAVVVHIGIGPHHGHYVALIKNNDRWILCDDENMEPIEENDLARYFGDYPAGSGYVLFYQAVDLDVTTLGLKVQPMKTKSASAAPAPSTPIVQTAPPVVIPVSPMVVSRSPQDAASPIFTPDAELLTDEATPFGTVPFSPKVQVAAALADYQAAVNGRAIPPQTPSAQSVSMSESYDSSRMDVAPQASSVGRSESSGRFIQPSAPQPMPPRDTPRAKPELPKESNNRFSGFFGGNKDKDADNKAKRSSVYGHVGGSQPSSASASRSSSGVYASQPPALDRSVASQLQAQPTTPSLGYSQPSGARSMTPVSREAPNNMTASMISTSSSGSRSGQSYTPQPPSPTPQALLGQPALGLSSASASRPGSSGGGSGFGGFASGLKRSATGLGRTEKGPEKEKDRVPSGGSLTRKLSTAGRTGLTRSTSSALGKFGFGKKDKDKSRIMDERDEGDSLMDED